jgi:hypothetical protein
MLSRNNASVLLKRASSSAARAFFASSSSSFSSSSSGNLINFKVMLDGERHDVSANENEQLSKVLAKNKHLVHAVPIISPVLGHDAHVIVPAELQEELGELTDAEVDKIEELCMNPIANGASRLASQVMVRESFAGKTFAVKGINRIMRT